MEGLRKEEPASGGPQHILRQEYGYEQRMDREASLLVHSMEKEAPIL